MHVYNVRMDVEIMILNLPLEFGLHVPSTVKNMKPVIWPSFHESVDR